MQLETERFYLVPLTTKQIYWWANDIQNLEKELSCSYQGEPMEGFFLDVVKTQIEKTSNDESNYLYHTFWLLIRKKDNIVVGSACFKDIPNVEGEVEIGYGLGKSFEKNGYMTESVRELCKWALEQNDINHVIAETNIDNPPSQNILKRCGFVQYRQDDEIWWKL